MSSVYVPAQVLVLLKRLANVVGTLSISHNYLVHRWSKTDDRRARGPEDPIPRTANLKKQPWDALTSLKAIEWPSWSLKCDWQHARNLIVNQWTSVPRDARSRKYGLFRMDTSSLPWAGRTITWPSTLAFQLNLNTNDPQDDPPPSPNRRTDKKQNENLFKPLPAHEQKLSQFPPDSIHRLLANPALYDPLLKPRFPIVLCHGLYGFDTRGPASFPGMRVHYWANVLKILRDKVGAEVIVTSVPGTGSIASRATRLDEQLQAKASGRGVNLLAHSMGGLDTRHLITHIKPSDYAPLSLTTVSTPHRGSPFMDWCAENIGIGKLRQQERELEYALKHDLPLDSLSSHTPEESIKSKEESSSFSLSFSSLPSSFTTLLLSIVDSPAYSNLTSAYLNDVFNPTTPNDPNVKYFSVASRLQSMSIWHPLWLPKLVLDETETKQRLKLKETWEQHHEGGRSDDDNGIPLWAQEREWGNDGLVTVQSAKWGEFLGIMEGCDHWEIRGARGLELEFPLLNNLSFSSLSPSNDSWSIMDWSRFVNAWRREERMERNAKLQSDTTALGTQPFKGPPPPTQTQSKQRQGQSAEDDAVVKASTDRLSTVLDWLVEQIPTPPKSLSTPFSNFNLSVNTPLKAPEKVAEAANEMVRELSKRGRSEAQSDVGAGASGAAKVRGNGKGNRNGAVKAQDNELARKEDLERFYVALSRKLYAEGL